MEALKLWLEGQMEARKEEPNSGLGKAIAYMLKQWIALTLFLRKAGAPLDKNVCERALKRHLHLKNSMSYKTMEGTQVGDSNISRTHTADIKDANPFENFVASQGSRFMV